MIQYRNGDLFEQSDVTHIVHQANLYHAFESGIAKDIKRLYPYAYQTDLGSLRGDRAKLGAYSRTSAFTLPVVFNMYSQDGRDPKERVTNYAAMGASLLRIERVLCLWNRKTTLLGIPHGIGCGLAGGDWNVVRAIIESAFAKSPVRVAVCKKSAKPAKKLQGHHQL